MRFSEIMYFIVAFSVAVALVNAGVVWHRALLAGVGWVFFLIATVVDFILKAEGIY